MSGITRATADDSGCWLAVDRSWTATANLVEIAWAYGMPVTDDDRFIVIAYLARESEIVMRGEPVDVIGAVIARGALADQAEAWLNENVAPEGYAFGWHKGEFFLWSDETWQQTR